MHADTEALRRAVATTLMPGFVGTTLPEWLAERLRGGLGAVCIFGPNIASPGQLRELTRDILDANPNAVIAVDEEGGDVTRLHHATGSPYPGNALLGRIGDTALTGEVARCIGWELRDAGITLTFAPDVDVNSNHDNPVIGVRSFGADPAHAAEHAAAWTRGMQSTGVAACAKHFPGHGDTAEDSHLSLPVVDRGLDELVERELVPFRAAVDAGVSTVMTSHILLPQLDGDAPSTFSPRILGGLLRGELGFGGVIVTDALDMKGASGERGIPVAAIAALAAGCDLLCLGTETTDEQLTAIESAVLGAIERGELDAGRVEDAAGRVLELARRGESERAAAPVPSPLPGSPVTPERVAGAFGATEAAHAWVREAPALYGVVELVTEANIAVGPAPWGPFAAAAIDDDALTSLFAGQPHRVITEAEDGSGDLPAELPVLVVGKANHRHAFAREAIDRLRTRHERVLVVDMGWPAPEEGYADLATYGASLLAGRVLLTVLSGRLPLG